MTKKAVSTMEIVSTVLGLLKTALTAFVMLALEYSKVEKSKARLREELAKSDLKIEKNKNAKKNDKRTSRDILSQFLGRK